MNNPIALAIILAVVKMALDWVLLDYRKRTKWSNETLLVISGAAYFIVLFFALGGRI